MIDMDLNPAFVQVLRSVLPAYFLVTHRETLKAL